MNDLTNLTIQAVDAWYYARGSTGSTVGKQKSVNLQYNMLVRWDIGTKDSSTKRLMFQASFFFIISYRLGALKTPYFY